MTSATDHAAHWKGVSSGFSECVGRCAARGACSSCSRSKAVEFSFQVAVEGQGLLWEGELPGEFRALSQAELNQAIQQSSSVRTGEVAESSGAAASPQLAGPRLHPMAPAIAGRSDMAASLHKCLQRFAEGSRWDFAISYLMGILGPLRQPRKHQCHGCAFHFLPSHLCNWMHEFSAAVCALSSFNPI